MIDTIKQMDCTGCKMCKDVCPKDAISYWTDREGFWYPKVDYDKCIKCGKCIKTCPSLSDCHNPVAGEPAVYAAWALDDSIRLKSTSGGIFYILAEEMLKEVTLSLEKIAQYSRLPLETVKQLAERVPAQA